MVGNTVEYNQWYRFGRFQNPPEKLIGIVVDAYTDVSGSISGKGSYFLGIGDSSTSGSTKSKRKYKVMYYNKYDSEKQHQYFDTINESDVIRIIEFGNEFKEEKFKTKKEDATSKP